MHVKLYIGTHCHAPQCENLVLDTSNLGTVCLYHAKYTATVKSLAMINNTF
jgi:hypothetical protein